MNGLRFKPVDKWHRMKALIVADLHFRWPWFEWISTAAKTVDLVLIPGDLLDIFWSDPPTKMQAVRVRQWLYHLAKERPVAFCSGNHDRHSLLDFTRAKAKLIPDGATEVLGDYVITTVPYWCDEQEKIKWLERGKAYRAGRKWIVLHHVPPCLRTELDKEEVEALKLLHNYRPDCFIAGHVHDFQRLTGSCQHRIGQTTVLVPGQSSLVALERALFEKPPPSPVPDHLIFDF